MIKQKIKTYTEQQIKTAYLIAWLNQLKIDKDTPKNHYESFLRCLHA